MRFVQVRNGGTVLICDTQYDPHRVLCVCEGYAGRINADYVIAALNYYNDALYNRFIGGNDGEDTTK